MTSQSTRHEILSRTVGKRQVLVNSLGTRKHIYQTTSRGRDRKVTFLSESDDACICSHRHGVILNVFTSPGLNREPGSIKRSGSKPGESHLTF